MALDSQRTVSFFLPRRSLRDDFLAQQIRLCLPKKVPAGRLSGSKPNILRGTEIILMQLSLVSLQLQEEMIMPTVMSILEIQYTSIL